MAYMIYSPPLTILTIHAPLTSMQYVVPTDQIDAAVSQLSLMDGKYVTSQGLYYELGIPNCEGVWPEEYGEV